MHTLTISPKFQVVIPKAIRERLGLSPGQKLQAVLYGDRIELMPLESAKRLRGFLKGIDTTALVNLIAHECRRLERVAIIPSTSLACQGCATVPRRPDAGPIATPLYRARHTLLMPAPTVYLGSTKLPRRTLPHWLSIMYASHRSKPYSLSSQSAPGTTPGTGHRRPGAWRRSNRAAMPTPRADRTAGSGRVPRNQSVRWEGRA